MVTLFIAHFPERGLREALGVLREWRSGGTHVLAAFFYPSLFAMPQCAASCPCTRCGNLSGFHCIVSLLVWARNCRQAATEGTRFR